MAEGETVFTFKANTKPAEEALDSFGDKVIGVGKAAAAAAAAYFSFQAISRGFEKAISSAMEAEQALRQFNSALAVTGNYTEAASSSFEQFASTLERTTGVSDEMILNNAALLVSIGNLSGKGLERATKAALDLSRGMQIDVASAFDIVTKATQGNVMALSRYGLEVGKADSDAQKFAKALDFIESRFKGLSTGAVNTFEGALAKVRNGFDNIFENAGKLITSNPKVIASLSVLGDIFYKISSAIESSRINIGLFVDGLFAVGKVVTQIMTPFEVLSRWLISTTLMIPRLVLTVYESIAGIADKLLGTDLQSKVGALKQAVTDIQTAAATPLFTDEELFSTRIGKSIDSTKIKVDELASKITTAVPNAAATASAKSLSYWEEFKIGFQENAQSMVGTFQTLGKSISGTLVNGFTNAFAAMGKALVTGQNAFGEFGKQVLSTIGAIAIQIGGFLILAGLGFSVIPGFQASAGAIAAGAALVVLGGVLQALGSGGGTPATPAGGGTGAVATGGITGPTPMAEMTPEQERAKAQTGVQVVVQGNIFDSRETGLQIAQIINDSFDLNGTIIRANV